MPKQGKPKSKWPEIVGQACRCCERTTFQPTGFCLQCAAAVNAIRKGNADRILEECLRVLEIPETSEAVRLVIDHARSKACPHRINDPNRHGRTQE